ncbi:hypothetical protein C4N9_15190 [Pararhodobacter marinus]|uniref:GspL cytoplasmic actin-ATPase-like domain-containing protein n=1 Tax=Pararhodobacter marinus TaxID=2184063 RepID=A0A2U2C7A8_9RHOB|nr:hypothetical protein [Pararhodobacter marinus]PWE27778.1 hypothetical protein C4N9_15190 [Pararhodobacter marinus]
MTEPAPIRRRRASVPALWRMGTDTPPPAGAFVALVPGADAPLIALSLPATLKGAAREDVARRQAQDRLGGGLDVRPARLGRAEDWSRVAVAERAAVLRWRAAIGAAMPRCRAVLPDFLALPAAPGLWTVEADRDGVRARLGPGDGFSAEHALAGRMLTLALSEARAAGNAPRAVLLTGETSGAFADLFDGIDILRDASDLPADRAPAILGHDELAVDFLRDPQADADQIETRLRRVVWPAALVVIGALSWAGAQALAMRNDRVEALALQDRTLEAVRRDILPSGPILDLELQVMQAIERRRNAGGDTAAPETPLETLRRAAPVLAGVELVTVSMATDGLSVEVRVPDFQSLDALSEALADAGIAARIAQSATDAEEGGVGATLDLEAGT